MEPRNFAAEGKLINFFNYIFKYEAKNLRVLLFTRGYIFKTPNGKK